MNENPLVKRFEKIVEKASPKELLEMEREFEEKGLEAPRYLEEKVKPLEYIFNGGDIEEYRKYFPKTVNDLRRWRITQNSEL